MNVWSDLQTPQKPPGAERFRLIETMRWEAGAVCYVDRHAARLARSAQHFGFPFAEASFQAVVRKVTTSLPEAPHRLRLTLGADGGMEGEAVPLSPPRQEPLRIAVAEARAHSDDPFFRHKTTWRRVYEQAFRAARNQGCDEALLLNERGELTEGTRANLFVEENGVFYTPPEQCGLLPGIGRAVWLAEEQAEERVLHRGDLRAADAVWLVSALRGRRRAVMTEGNVNKSMRNA